MSSLTHIFGELDRPKIECATDEPCIWIRARHDTVSLTLNREQRQKLRAALDECDEFEEPVVLARVETVMAMANEDGSVTVELPRPADQRRREEDARRLRVLQANLRGEM